MFYIDYTHIASNFLARALTSLCPLSRCACLQTMPTLTLVRVGHAKPYGPKRPQSTHTHTHIFHHQCISSPPHVGQSAQAHALSFWLCHSRSVAAHTCAATVLHVCVRSLCGRFCVVVAVMVCFYLCCASAYTHGHYASLFRAVCNSIRLAGGVLAENKPSDRLWPHRADCRCRRSSFTYMFRTYMFRNRAPKKRLPPPSRAESFA